MRGGRLRYPGTRGSPGATADEQRRLHHSQHAGDREDERDLEDHGERAAVASGRDARGVGRTAGDSAAGASGRVLQGPGEDRAQTSVDRRDRRGRRSRGAGDRETAGDRGAR